MKLYLEDMSASFYGKSFAESALYVICSLMTIDIFLNLVFVLNWA